MHQTLIRTIRLLILVALLFLLSVSIAITAQPLDRLANKKIIFVSGYKGFFQPTDREVNPLEEDWKPLRDHLVSKYRELRNDDFFFYSYSGEYHNNDYSDPDYMASDTCLGVIKEKLVSSVCILAGVDYDKRAEYMDEIVQAVVNANPGAEIEIIGHSLGGVVSTYWAATTTKPELLDSINSIITLDSPLQGEGGRCWRRIGFTVIPFDVTSKITSSVVKVPHTHY